MRRPGHSSYLFLAPAVSLLLPSQYHSTALPSPKRYDKRYEDLYLSGEAPSRHATIAMTPDTSSHMLPGMGCEAAEAIGEALG